MQRKYVWIYLAWVFGAAWFMWMIAIAVGTNHFLYHLNTVVAMYAPTYAFFITQKISKNTITLSAKFTFGFRKNWKYYLIAWLAPTVAAVAGAVFYYLWFPWEFDPSFTFAYLLMQQSGSDMPVQKYIFVCFANSASYMPFINMFLAMGEEVGWRGYLYPELSKQYSPWKAHLLTALIWGFWHTPLNMTGYNYGTQYGGYPVIGILAMCLFCFSASVIMTELTEKSKSIFPACLMHGAINAVSSAGTMVQGVSYLDGSTMIFGPSLTGIIAGVPALLIAVIILLKNHKNNLNCA